MKVYVNYDDARWRKYKIDFRRIAAAAGPRRPGAEVSITLVDDATLHRLNKEYRDMDRATNVLSFELGDEILLGDIYISLDTVAREAAAAGISVAEHTAHMVVHGMLHLQGYDHIRDDEAAVMESREVEILKNLGIKNPYADEAPAAARGMRGLVRALGLALAGVAASFGFAPFHLWPVTMLAIGAAYWILTSAPRAGVARTFLRAAPFGAAYGVAMFWWALSSIYVVPELARQFAIWTVPGLLGLGLAGALVFSIPFVAATRARGAARIFVFAGTWSAVLWAREWMFTGFPWNPIANIMLPVPAVANAMALFGALGLTFVIVGIIAGAVEILRDKKCAMCWISWFAFILMLCGGLIYGRHNIYMSAAMPEPDTYGPLVRVVQPATSQDQKMSYSRADAVARAERNVRNLLALGAGGDGARPDLIVYPETTYPFVITDDDMPFSKILDTDVILGATSYRDGRLYNSMIVADRAGRVVHAYDKAHLVPFGEYGPLGIMPSPANLASGAGRVALDIDAGGGRFVFAPAICYEIIFSDSLIPDGVTPNAIINITNDTWFGRTPGTYQHLDMVRRYAIESGVPVIRANYSGISAFVAPDGRVTSMLPVGRTGVLDGRVNGAHMTAYRALGRDAWILIILIVASVGAAAAARRRD